MDDSVKYIAIAIPVFFLLISIEYLIARSHAKQVYRLNDSINDLATGTIQQIVTVFTRTVAFAGYIFLFHFAIFDISTQSIVAWILCILGVDFFYYWFHRLSHEINFLWAAHIVHHQSEEFNFTVALRQSAIQNLLSIWFYLPLALMGFPPMMFLIVTSFHTIYQFWIHTELIKNLGPLEWVLNTPSHHRVHHGCNAQYIDRNHAGLLIIWDKLFGTFEPEQDKVVYGLTKPLKSWNPVWANIHYFIELANVATLTKRWKDKFAIWFSNPAWRPRDVPHPAIEKTPLKGFKYDANAPMALRIYATFYFLSTIIMLLFLLYRFQTLFLPQQLAIVIYIIWTLLNVGAMFELKKWLNLSEILRIITCYFLMFMLLQDSPYFLWLALGTTIIALGSLFCFLQITRYDSDHTPVSNLH